MVVARISREAALITTGWNRMLLSIYVWNSWLTHWSNWIELLLYQTLQLRTNLTHPDKMLLLLVYRFYWDSCSSLSGIVFYCNHHRYSKVNYLKDWMNWNCFRKCNRMYQSYCCLRMYIDPRWIHSMWWLDRNNPMLDSCLENRSHCVYSVRKYMWIEQFQQPLIKLV